MLLFKLNRGQKGQIGLGIAGMFGVNGRKVNKFMKNEINEKYSLKYTTFYKRKQQ